MNLLDHLQTFVRIAEAKNISRAARSLGISTAMASRQLRALEQDLGVSLVRRTTRRLDLTEAGLELLDRARKLLAGADEARAAVQPGRGASGLLVMSVPVPLGLAAIAPLLPKLLRAHPRLSLDVRFDDRLVELPADGIDLAVRVGEAPPDTPYLVARKLASYERILCATPSFLRKHPVPGAEALARTPCLVLGAAPTRWRLQTASGVVLVTVEGPLRTNNMLALRDAALSGLGVAPLPAWLVHDDLRRRRLVRVLDDARLPTMQVMGLTHVDARGAHALRAVQDFLARALPGALGDTSR